MNLAAAPRAWILLRRAHRGIIEKQNQVAALTVGLNGHIRTGGKSRDLVVSCYPRKP